jgi:diguanylate cyclase
LNISELTRRAIQLISKNGSSVTPLIFYETFCAEARRNRVEVEDCGVIKTYIEKLDADFQKEAQRYNIRTIQEFLSYLTSALNRMNQNHLAHRHNSLLQLTQAIIKTVSSVDNRDITELSGRTDAMLHRGHSSENLDDMKREWLKLSPKRWKISREKLGKYVQIEKDDDLDSIVEKVVPILEANRNGGDNRKVVELLFKGMKPSLSQMDEKDILSLYRDLRTHPEKIHDKKTQEKIGKLQDNRIDRDREEEKKGLSRVGKVIDTLSKKVAEERGEREEDLNGDLKSIEDEVKSAEESGDSSSIFGSLSKKLSNLKNRTSSLFGSLKKYRGAIESAKEEVTKAIDDLVESRHKNDEDLLTGLGTEKSLNRAIGEMEKRFQKKGENFSVIVIDIDDFRNICKKFGDDAGDLVLRYFSKILKSYIAVGDSTARVGEDEFVITLPNRDLDDALNFADRFQEKVRHTKFLYKDERVNITFSGGVAERKSANDFQEVLDKAHRMMREAKRRGRDRVFPD